MDKHVKPVRAPSANVSIATLQRLAASASAPNPMRSGNLEAKLDDLVALLRSQGVEKQSNSPTQVLQMTALPYPYPTDNNEPSATSVTATERGPTAFEPPRDPNVIIDVTASAVRLTRPDSPPPTSSPILEDILPCAIPDNLAEEQIRTFRSAFLPMFPFVHLPLDGSASQLRHQKPFLWLVIMCLTTKSVSQQFDIEKMVWGIISRRIVSEHLADLDLLLGVICFASWSHYFKKDKPFMNMLTQLALSLVTELGLHKEVVVNRAGHENSFGSRLHDNLRTIEERRTILAMFHLAASAWAAYRKIEPLRWNRYLDECLRIVGETNEAIMDRLLITQVKCQLLTHQLTCPSMNDLWEEDGLRPPSMAVATALLEKVEGIRGNLPPSLRSENTAQFYIDSAKLTILSMNMGRPIAQDHADYMQLQMLQAADATLHNIESWLSIFFEMPLLNWIGISVDVFAQFTHCLVMLFKLTTLERPGWDSKEVMRRANVFEILDRAAQTVDRVPVTLGIVDAEGPRRGLLFKTSYLLRAIKALFLAEMGPQNKQEEHSFSAAQNDSAEFGDDEYFSDEFLQGLWEEPWFSDIMTPL
ncbi:hypothetical protein NPX13_g3552 [Xylaria arbuscula]|uniref:Transcription factor domain-containing protein n=1 Tax=Xylaria arbuscula TaxID=114810 RepID=A0A9W8NHJ5_9PEZI|nr:hypothetical protein NPX13_g3552 [Xylaria arbuscula]